MTDSTIQQSLPSLNLNRAVSNKNNLEMIPEKRKGPLKGKQGFMSTGGVALQKPIARQTSYEIMVGNKKSKSNTALGLFSPKNPNLKLERVASITEKGILSTIMDKFYSQQ